MRFDTMRRGGEIPDHQIELDGIRYWSQPIKEIRFEGDGSVLVFEGLERVRECEHCGRADWVPRVASSWEEAIEKRWLQRVCPFKDVTTSEDRAADQMVIRFECGVSKVVFDIRGRNPLSDPRTYGVFVAHDCQLEQIPTKVT